MVINIFGVGRAMTKAATLQVVNVLQCMADQKIWLNYEPYYWEDRYARYTNSRGIAAHEEAPLLMNADEEIGSNDRFLHSLIKEQNKYHIVNKYIRGMGRIGRINHIQKPELSIIVVRNIYSQLASIFMGRWDLLGQGLKHRHDKSRFLSEIEKIEVPDKNYLISVAKNRLDINALYWFVMNYVSIKNSDEKTIIIFDDEIAGLESKLISTLLPNRESVHEGGFHSMCNVPGHEIHGDKFLEGWGSGREMFYNISNAIKVLFDLNLYPLWHRQGSGVCVKGAAVSKYMKELEGGAEMYSEYGGVGKVKIVKNEVYDFMNNELVKLLESKGHK